MSEQTGVGGEESVSGELGERVRALVAAAEGMAAAVRSDADNYALTRRREVDAEAERRLREASEQADALLAERLTRISDLSDRILERAEAVLDAFEFDDTEHLYEFRYRDQTGAPRVYNHYYCEEGPYAHQIKMGEIGLPEKGTLRFHFDFGDDWRFVLRLERIARADKRIRRPTVIESCGEPPKQYPNAEG